MADTNIFESAGDGGAAFGVTLSQSFAGTADIDIDTGLSVVKEFSWEMIYSDNVWLGMISDIHYDQKAQVKSGYHSLTVNSVTLNSPSDGFVRLNTSWGYTPTQIPVSWHAK